jgi:tetratricopeptide (TPR) repeat protein
MRKLLVPMFLAGAALAACQEPDPLAEARRTCASESAESEARMSACTELIESGAIEGAERAAALANRGAATEAAGDVTNALRDYAAALDLAPETMRAVAGRAGILLESGQLDAAEPLVQWLIESGEYAERAHFFAGELARKRGDWGAASDAYGRAIAADSQSYQSFSARAGLKHDQQDYAGALDDYNRAIAVNPQYTPALAGRCWTRVLMEDGDLAAARRDADQAATADPRNVQAQLCRGLLQLRAEEWLEAKASYDAALEVEPGNPSALFGRGVARRRSGDGEGREDMNRARDFSSNIGRTFEELGVVTY